MLALCSAQYPHVQVRQGPLYNFMTPTGLLTTVNVLRGVKSGGVVLMAPPCSSWVLLCMSLIDHHVA